MCCPTCIYRVSNGQVRPSDVRREISVVVRVRLTSTPRRHPSRSVSSLSAIEVNVVLGFVTFSMNILVVDYGGVDSATSLDSANGGSVWQDF